MQVCKRKGPVHWYAGDRLIGVVAFASFEQFRDVRVTSFGGLITKTYGLAL